MPSPTVSTQEILDWLNLGGETDDLTGEQVGPLAVTDRLGAGGMGVVYRAYDAGLKREVALKILPALLEDVPARRALFEREQQTLAQLVHPHVAQLYAGGVTEAGRPYFEMELVEGRPLDAYADAERLAVPGRLRLFLQVCDAVAYVHRRGVLHRDLKPSNLLVTEAGQVKLLDFGVATFTEDTAADGSGREVGRPLTLAYASPEQLGRAPATTLSDVYALGVVLYELLAGRRPYHLKARSFEDAARALQDVPVSPLDEASSADAAARRRTTPDRLRRALRGDLDAVVRKAMALDPAARYASAEALADDIRKVLEDRPVEARAASAGYRMGKFLRRHRAASAATALALTVLVAVVAVYTWQLRIARDRALAEAERSQRTQDFMLALIRGDEAAGPADTLRVLSLLDQGVRQARMLDADPGHQAELLGTLGSLYTGLGRLDRADSLLTVALTRPVDAAGAAANRLRLARLRAAQGRFEEAAAQAEGALTHIGEALPPEHPLHAEALTVLGATQRARNDYEGTARRLEAAVRLYERYPPSPGLSEALGELAALYYDLEDFDSLDSINAVALRHDRRLFGDDHPNVGSTYMNLGTGRRMRNDYEGAVRYYRLGSDIYVRYYGSDHPTAAMSRVMLAGVLKNLGEYDEAEQILVHALAVFERHYGERHARIASTLSSLGSLAKERGDYNAALGHFTRMRGIYTAIHGPDDPLVGLALANRSDVYLDMGDHRRAEEDLRAALAVYALDPAPDPRRAATAKVKLGRVLLLQQRYREAEPLLLEGYAYHVTQDPSSFLRYAREGLVEVYVALDRPEERARFQEELDASVRP